MAYYDHRHSVKDETNILKVVKAVKGETENNKVLPFFGLANEIFHNHKSW